jgi:hypothetical protein
LWQKIGGIEMSEELKTCPFCEGKAKILFDESNNSFDISCCNCNAKITGFYAYYGNKNAAKETAIAAWNRSAQPDNLPHDCGSCIWEDKFTYESPCSHCSGNPKYLDAYAHRKGGDEG